VISLEARGACSPACFPKGTVRSVREENQADRGLRVGTLRRLRFPFAWTPSQNPAERREKFRAASSPSKRSTERRTRWRREWNSNPRYLLGTHAFQACAFSHLAISRHRDSLHDVRAGDAARRGIARALDPQLDRRALRKAKLLRPARDPVAKAVVPRLELEARRLRPGVAEAHGRTLGVEDRGLVQLEARRTERHVASHLRDGRRSTRTNSDPPRSPADTSLAGT
jgi:hypothetical protein